MTTDVAHTGQGYPALFSCCGNSARPMIYFRLAVALMLCAACVFLSAVAADAKKAAKKALPTLTAFRVDQSGDSELFLSLEGTKFPAPEVRFAGDDRTEIFLPGVDFPAGEYERVFDVPLLDVLRAERTDDGALVTLYTEKKLRFAGKRGVGSGSLRLHFSAVGAPEGKPSELLSAHSPSGLGRKRINLSLKDCDLHDVFRALSSAGGMNVVVDSTVPTNVKMTLDFKGAPFDEVMDFVLRAQNLSCKRVGRTLVVAAASSYSLVSGKILLHGYRISYAEPDKLVPLVKELASLDSPVNKVVADTRTRLLFVQGSAEQHERVRRLLERLDAPGRQVMLKARIIEISDEANEELQTAINAVYDWWWGSYQSGTFSTGAARSTTESDTVLSSLPNIDTSSDLPGTIGDGVVSIANTATRMLDFRISALVEEDKARVLADPTVTVLDGKTATVKLIEKLKYVSERDDANNPTYDDEEVGPQMEVTPRVGRDGVISLTVSLETGEVTQWLSGGQGEQIPQINSRSLKTEIRVRNGEPFVVGGLFKESKTKNKATVPVLSSIPLLGELFKYKVVKNTRSQLVMVIVPYVLDIPYLAINGEKH